MRTRGQTHVYVIPELAVKLHAADGPAVDTAIAYDVGVMVTFDYEYATEDEAAQAIIKGVTGAAALEGERTTVSFWAGCDVMPYLPEAEIEAIAEAMVDWMAEVIKDENDNSLLHAAGI